MNIGYGPGWTASLDLQFERAKNRSIVSRCRHNGPLRVQKPFYPVDGVCHVYLLHPPGGVVGGDELSVSVRAGEGSAALITTPGATRVYRSAGPLSTIKYQLNVEAGASLEWLPQDTILYGGSRLSQETEVRVESDSRFCGWEITSMGRPASGDHYSTGEFDQGFRLYVDSLPVLMERQRWRAGAEAGAGVLAGAEAGVLAGTEAEAGTEVGTEARTEAEAGTEVGTEARTEAEASTEAGTVAEAKTEARTEARTEAGTEGRTEGMTEGGTVAGTVAGTGTGVLEASWGLSGHTVLGTFYGFPADDDVLSHLRLCLEDISVGEIAVTLVDEVLVVRALADDAVALRQVFADIWLSVREMINGFPPGSPRVWAT